MDSEKRTEMLHDLDLKYRRSTHECDLLIKDEDARRIKLRSMLHRDEASLAKEQLANRDTRIKELVEQIEDARSQLQSAEEKSRRQDKLIQTHSREIANLKEELSAFGAVSQDSTKLLSEKLALSREVAVLKPELEHLQSQLAHQKDVLAEKLALERQLNTLEVELANERRAAEKAAQKQEREGQNDGELSKQVRELEKELAKEKRLVEKNMKSQENKNGDVEEELQSLREQLATAEQSLVAEKRKTEKSAKTKNSAESEMQEEMEQLREGLEEAQKALAAEKRAAQRQAKSQVSGSSEELEQLQEELTEARQTLADDKKGQEKLRKAHDQALVDAEDRQQALLDRVEKLRGKLSDTRDELKKCRAELEKAQERAVKIPSVATTTIPLKGAGAKVNAKKKRAADEMSIDDKVLLTPGNMDDRPKRPLKKRGFDLSMVGGKSEFSITPFLNKTTNLDDASKPAPEETTPTVQFRGADEPATAAPEPASEEEESKSPTPEPATTTANPKLVEKKPRGRPRTKPLADAPSSKQNLTTTARSRKPPRIESTLENVAEEPDSGAEQDPSEPQKENRSSTEPNPTLTTKPTTALPAVAEPKKKKRKLLGQTNTSTLFDSPGGTAGVGGGEDGERVKPVPAVAGATKRPPVAGKGAAGVKGRVGGVKSAFGGKTFSPLKRDRRGVGASFLV